MGCGTGSLVEDEEEEVMVCGLDLSALNNVTRPFSSLLLLLLLILLLLVPAAPPFLFFSFLLIFLL